MSSYSSSWADMVKRGVSSYVEALKRLKDSRKYSGIGITGVAEDTPPSSFPIKRWIPLLWGTF